MTQVWIKYRETGTDSFDYKLVDLYGDEMEDYWPTNSYPATEEEFDRMILRYLNSMFMSLYPYDWGGSSTIEWMLVDKPSLEWLDQQSEFARSRMVKAEQDYLEAKAFIANYYGT